MDAGITMMELDPSTSTSPPSLLEQLPTEILHKVLTYLKPNAPSNTELEHHLRHSLPGKYPRYYQNSHRAIQFLTQFPADPNLNNSAVDAQRNLLSCLLISRTIHVATLPILYRRISVYKYSCVVKLAAQISRYPHLGQYVRRLDLNGLQKDHNDLAPAGEKRGEVISALLMQSLNFMPRLWELRTPVDSMDGFDWQLLDFRVLQNILRGKFQHLRILDWGPKLSDAFLDYLENEPIRVSTSITHLKLRCEDTRMTGVIKRLLTAMPSIQILDFSGSNVKVADVLEGIPTNARLTSLKTTLISSAAWSDVSSFMNRNPSIFEGLMVLDLSRQWTLPLESPDDISGVLYQLPPSLRSLNLRNCSMEPSHLDIIREQCPKLMELSIGTGIRLHDLESTILPPHIEKHHDDQYGENSNSDDSQDDSPAIDALYGTILGPMGRAVALCKLRKRLNSVSVNRSGNMHHKFRMSGLQYLDIRSLPIEEQRKIRTSILLGQHSQPLGIIQISGSEFFEDGMLHRLCSAVGWRFCWRGGRAWIARK
ncbi:uncharacterized protein BP5553_00118 [Venustampulla echinocandica]|uniref:F-box domain-containing protein n=1 Tax=Venustampulla echinocandica TaxID=2656787 RepID=A0A370TXA2_9HELO|nr:uncharacterized protein BP5553_00118 [Venustampulla echinocandica]RDL40139.1 hypothetical protein BP5553_00118 [Venustampulla echinocandica]